MLFGLGKKLTLPTASDAIVGATLVPPALEEEIEEVVDIQSGDAVVIAVAEVVEDVEGETED